MSKVKIVVVEDEIIIADNICEILEDIGYEVFEPAISYAEAIKTIEENKPDLLLVDIQLSGKKDGIDLGSKVNKDFGIPFIFLTSNADKQTVDRAKKVNPAAYLVKPFIKEDLYSSIEIALYNYTKKTKDQNEDLVIKQALFVKQNNAFLKVKFEDILFLQSDHVYVKVFATGNRKFLIRSSLTELVNKLDKQFIKVHRSYIINLAHMEGIKNNLIELVEDYKVPISKQYKSELLSKLNIG